MTAVTFLMTRDHIKRLYKHYLSASKKKVSLCLSNWYSASTICIGNINCMNAFSRHSYSM